MNGSRPAPDDLKRLVEHSLPPRAVMELDWYDFDFHEWRFRLRWFERRFVLRIPADHWSDGRVDLVSLCSAFGAPRPDATLGRSRFTLRLERQVPDDSTRYEFSLFSNTSDNPRRVTVVVGGSAGGVLAARAGRREEEAFKLLVALWLFKDTVDLRSDVNSVAIDPMQIDSFLARRRVPDMEVREYVGLKLYQTYQVAGNPTPVEFGEQDFGYLGISREDFQRAVLLWNQKGWTVEGVSLTPTNDLLERLDAEDSRERRAAPAAAMSTPLRDLFVSYASEDKDAFVRPLVEALTPAGLTVWFDEYELVLGDSLRRKIDEGLRNSRHGLVVLSHDFFRKEWPQKELDGLFSLIDEGRRIMPIWHGLTKQDISTYAPTLAGIVGIKSSKGIEEIVAEVVKAVGRRKT